MWAKAVVRYDCSIGGSNLTVLPDGQDVPEVTLKQETREKVPPLTTSQISEPYVPIVGQVQWEVELDRELPRT